MSKLTPAVRCQTCNGTGHTKLQVECHCVKICVTCQKFDRNPTGSCRNCNKIRNKQRLSRTREKVCNVCHLTDKTTSGRCRVCRQRWIDNRMLSCEKCPKCASVDWDSSGHCRECHRHRKTSHWYLRLVQIARKRSKKFDVEKSELVTPEWVQEQFQLQNGKCFYTYVSLEPLKFGSSTLFQPSLDRIDNNQAYTKSNVRLTSLGWNFMRNSASCEEAARFLKSVGENQ